MTMTITFRGQEREVEYSIYEERDINFVEVNWKWANPDFKPNPEVTEEEDEAIQDHIYKNDDRNGGDY